MPVFKKAKLNDTSVSIVENGVSHEEINDNNGLE